MSAAESVVVEGSRTKISIYHTIVDEAFSTGDASSWYNNGKMVALVCRIQLLIRCGIASWKNHNFDMRSLFHLVIKAAKVPMLYYYYACQFFNYSHFSLMEGSFLSLCTFCHIYSPRSLQMFVVSIFATLYIQKERSSIFQNFVQQK